MSAPPERSAREAGLFAARAGNADLEALAALELRSQVHPWTPAMLAAELATTGTGGVVVLRGGPEARLVAYAAFRLVADELHVHNLLVAPELRGRGLGRFLLRLVLRLGRGAGARSVELEVRAGNAAARALYAAEGFAVVSRRRAYYLSPGDDAVVLQRILEPRVPGVVTSPKDENA